MATLNPSPEDVALFQRDNPAWAFDHYLYAASPAAPAQPEGGDADAHAQIEDFRSRLIELFYRHAQLGVEDDAALAEKVIEQLGYSSASRPAPAQQAVTDGWIPASERLPTEEDYADYEDVLVRYRYTKGGRMDWDVGESFHDPDHKHNKGWHFGSCYHAQVSHWMPKAHLLALTSTAAKAAEGAE